MRWVRHDTPARRGQLRRLLEHVRLPLLAPAYFLEKVEADELLQACGECRPLLPEARACFILGREAGVLRARPRGDSYLPPCLMPSLIPVFFNSLLTHSSTIL
ncbi:KLHL5 protein-like protein [Camelus ferus]|nr:KLHL5 protein-like protein [Camelus ferus]